MASDPRTVENALWTVENAMKIKLGKGKAINFTTAQEKNFLNYFFVCLKNSGSKQLQIFRNNHKQ
jgi:hypothetical protein